MEKPHSAGVTVRQAMDDTNELRERLIQALEYIAQTISFYAGRGALTLAMYEAAVRVINEILEEIDKLG